MERLYYRLQADFAQGYDEFCLVDTMAIVEQEVSLDIRSKKEYLRNELTMTERPSLKVSGQADLPPDFWVYLDLECKVRSLKRLYRDNPEQAKEVVEGLRAIAKTSRADDDHPRIKLCKAEALITIYEYVGVDQPTAVSDLNTALDILNTVAVEMKDYADYEKGQVRDYVFWQKHILLGRANFNLGVISLEINWSLDEAIAYFRAAIEAYKQARSRIDIYLNDTRNTLAYAYNLRGLQNMATETIRVSLQKHELYGHKLYISLAHNIEAQIQLSSRATLDQAYETSRASLELISQDFEPDELTDLPAYRLLQRYKSEISRRVGRHHADYADLTRELHLNAIENLEETTKYYQNLGWTRQLIESQNELGCAYRSWGRSLQIQFESTDNAGLSVERDKAFQKAKDLFETVKEMYKASTEWWYQRQDNLQDLVQLATYRNAYSSETMPVEVVESLIAQAKTDLDTLENSPDPGKALFHKPFSSKLSSREAEWAWKRYSDLDKNSKADKPTKKDLLKAYIEGQIEALNWYAQSQPNLLLTRRADGSSKLDADLPMSYARESLYLNRLDSEIGQNLSGAKERKVTIEVVEKLLEKPEEPRDGTVVFCYMVDISRAVDLAQKIKKKAERENSATAQPKGTLSYQFFESCS